MLKNAIFAPRRRPPAGESVGRATPGVARRCPAPALRPSAEERATPATSREHPDYHRIVPEGPRLRRRSKVYRQPVCCSTGRDPGTFTFCLLVEGIACCGRSRHFSYTFGSWGLPCESDHAWFPTAEFSQWSLSPKYQRFVASSSWDPHPFAPSPGHCLVCGVCAVSGCPAPRR